MGRKRGAYGPVSSIPTHIALEGAILGHFGATPLFPRMGKNTNNRPSRGVWNRKDGPDRPGIPKSLGLRLAGP